MFVVVADFCWEVASTLEEQGTFNRSSHLIPCEEMGNSRRGSQWSKLLIYTL